MEKAKSDNSGLVQGNAEKKPVWNRSCNGDSEIRPVIGASSWPLLSETKKASSSSSDSLKSLGDGSSSSSSVPVSQKTEILTGALAFTEQMEKCKRTFASASTNGTLAQPSGPSSYDYSELPLHYPFSRGQNQRNEFASQSHGGSQNQYQQNSYKNQNGNHDSHRNHQGRRNQEQDWNLHGNFNGRGGFAQLPRGGFAQPSRGMSRGGFAQPPRAIPGFVQHAPPPMLPHYVPLHQPFYPFSGPMVFPEWASSPMYHPHHMPFIESPPYVFLVQDSSLKTSQFQDSSLETRIRNQVHYYFSDENLRKDEFLCKRMNDEGFVHIQFIAGFRKLKALTSNIELILNALQGSDVVELKGYEIRNRNNWREFVMLPESRAPFYPSPEYVMASKVQNMSLEPKADEIESSSSNQSADENNSSRLP